METYSVMDESLFKESLAAIMSGEYTENDKKTVNEWLSELLEEEVKLKRQLEKNKREFVKKRDKITSELNKIKGEIKDIKRILHPHTPQQS